ncbi:hypothetical protein CEXT_702211 [Caerostris extrusa]|uniref:Uncharacterized protein n=1 Tax=Caerostris extrusa TaxID=172846 RepID=A0AAV4XTW0_CAEEX|nr:hypothetical protein CEXT_702211 [Caerostris extrusa]
MVSSSKILFVRPFKHQSMVSRQKTSYICPFKHQSMASSPKTSFIRPFKHQSMASSPKTSFIRPFLSISPCLCRCCQLPNPLMSRGNANFTVSSPCSIYIEANRFPWWSLQVDVCDSENDSLSESWFSG